MDKLPTAHSAETPSLRGCPVYLGAAGFAAGPAVALEQEIADPALCAALRAPAHGAAHVPRWERDIVELVEAAVRKCLAASGRDASDIDTVLLTSNGLDAQNSLEATWLGQLSKRLGLESAAHYQIGMAGCAGFHWAARLAAGLVGSGQGNHVLLISFDKAGDPLQRFYGEIGDFCYVTGDAAAACLVSNSARDLQYRLVGQVVNVWDAGQILQVSADEEMRSIARLFKETYARAGISAADVDLLIPNNYSMQVSRLYGMLADLGQAQVFTDAIASHAHCFGSDNVINLCHAQDADRIAAGQRVMLFSAGPFQWGACVLEKLH